MTRIFLVVTSVALSSCVTMAAPGIGVAGEWGGPHIGLKLSEDGGTIEYDCATGSLAPIVPEEDGTFEVQGTHTPGHGGPAIEGEVLPVYRVRFTGTVSKDRMSLTGRVENGILLGPFTLVRGAEPGIFRCL